MKHMPAQKGDLIIMEGSLATELYFIVLGSCRVYTKWHSDKKIEMGMLSQGSFFGEQELLTDHPVRRRTVVAADDCDMSFVSFTVLKGLQAQYPAFKNKLRDLSAKRVRSDRKLFQRKKKQGWNNTKLKALRGFMGGSPLTRLKLAGAASSGAQGAASGEAASLLGAIGGGATPVNPETLLYATSHTQLKCTGASSRGILAFAMRDLPAFKGLSTNTRNWTSSRFVSERLSEGDDLLKTGQQVAAIFILVRGEMKVSEVGKKSVIAQPGACFCERSLVEFNQFSVADVITHSRSAEVLKLDRVEYMKSVSKNGFGAEGDFGARKGLFSPRLKRSSPRDMFRVNTLAEMGTGLSSETRIGEPEDDGTLEQELNCIDNKLERIIAHLQNRVR